MQKILMYLFFMLFVFILSGCNQGYDQKVTFKSNFEKFEIKTGTLVDGDSYIGYTEPIDKTVLSTKLGGRIVDLKFEKSDFVGKDWLLGSVEATEVGVNIQSSENILNATKLVYDNTSSMFDAQIKAMEEKVEQSREGMELAKQSLEGVETGLSDTENITQQQLLTAEKQVNQAEVGIESIKSQLENTKQLLNQKEQDIYSNSKNALSQSKILGKNILEFIDKLLGITDKNRNANDSFEQYLGVKNSDKIVEATKMRRDLNNELNDWVPEVDSVIQSMESVDVTGDEQLKAKIYDLLIQTENGYVKLRELMNLVYDIVDGSVSSPSFTQNMIDSYKYQVVTYQNNIENILLSVEGNFVMGLKGSRQSIDNFEKEKKMQIDSLEKQLDLAESQLETAKQTYNQYKATSEGKINEVNTQKSITSKQLDIAKKQYDEAIAGLEALKSQKQTQLSQIEAQLDEIRGNKSMASVQMGNSKIISPFDGIIVKKMANLGQVVGPGTPIYSLADNNEIKVVIDVSESNISKIKVGDKINVEIKGLNKIYKGEILKISPMSDVSTKKIPVEIKIVNDGNLKFGMYAHVFTDGDNINGIVVPYRFIRYEYGKSFIYASNDDGDKIDKIDVDILKCIDDECVIDGKFEGYNQFVNR